MGIYVCDACFCCYDGCLLEGCVGCMGSNTVLCYEMEFCCRPGSENTLTPCYCFGCRCISPTVCIKSQGQCCCEAGAMAIPCDEEVPCMFGTCMLICYPSFGCGRQLKDIVE